MFLCIRDLRRLAAFLRAATPKIAKQFIKIVNFELCRVAVCVCACVCAMNFENVLFANLAPPSRRFLSMGCLSFKSLKTRISTLNDTNLSNDDKKDLARKGIFYSDRMFKCAYCTYSTEKYDEKALKYHTYSACPKSLERLATNAALRKRSYTSFKIARKRVKSPATVSELVTSGFYFDGERGDIRCSSCLLTLTKLPTLDSVNNYHATFSPSCSYVGAQTPSAPPLNVIESPTDLTPTTKTTTSALLETTSSLTESYTNYPNLEENKALIKNKNNNHESGDSTWLSDEKLCRICLERERNVCFLPCRHLSTCDECAQRCKTCCICREKIKNKFVVYM